MATRKDKQCIHPDCTNPQHARGLCTTCYHRAYRLMEDGRVTEEQLIKSGKLLPAWGNPRSRINWFMEEVAV